MEGCIESSHSRDEYGYGRIGKRRLRAHRVAWEQAHGPIPPGRVVMHLCDNPPCVNIDHLRLGTQRENIQMAADHGHLPRKGESNPRAKLTEDDVRAIRTRLHEACSAIAADYGVNHCTIRDILRGRTWGHLPWSK